MVHYWDKIASISLIDDVIEVKFEPNVCIDLEYARHIVQKRIEISKQFQYPLYVDIRGIISIDQQARKYLASEEGSKSATYAAIHVESSVSKFLGKLFILIDKPPKPVQIFTNKDKALNWLKKIEVKSSY